MPLTQVSSRAIEDTLRYVLGASGTNHYTFTGKGLTGAVNDPTLTLSRGHTYIFENRSGGHPFYIKTSIANGGTNDAYNTGVTNNGGGNGTEIVFTVPHDAPDVLYYQCSSHINMAGQLTIAGGIPDGSITDSKLASSSVTAAKIASGNVDNTAIGNNQISLNKFQQGTPSNDGKFLRANNGADPTFETIDLTALSASNLTSGIVPTARISEASVTQHVTPFDDNKVINDISALALKVSALENSTAANTNSTYVDTFQDSNGISASTNVFRDTTGEFFASIGDQTLTYDFNVAGTHGEPALRGLIHQNTVNNSYEWTNDQVQGRVDPPTSTYGLTVIDFAFDLSGDFTAYIWWRSSSSGVLTTGAYGTASALILPVTTITSGKSPTLSGNSIFTINSTTRAALQLNQSGQGAFYINDNSTNNTLANTFSSSAYSTLNISSIPAASLATGNSQTTRNYSSSANAYGYNVSSYLNAAGGSLGNGMGNDGYPHGMKWEYTKANNTMIMGYVKSDTGTFKSDNKMTITNLPTAGRVLVFGGHGSGSSGDTSKYFSLRNSAGTNSTGTYIKSESNATGNFISNTITASASTSKMGAVITYIDHAGTATLNTDLKLYVSADNGANYTQVTLVAQPVFATGVKMALANDVTVTAGTQLKYKVEFANQALGSKETRVTGVSLQY